MTVTQHLLWAWGHLRRLHVGGALWLVGWCTAAPGRFIAMTGGDAVLAGECVTAGALALSLMTIGMAAAA